MNFKYEGKLLGAGILSAVAASLCCITPLLAIIAGSGSLFSILSWSHSARPYLIGATFLLLVFAWFQKLKQKAVDDCCTPQNKSNFIQSKKFLFLITIISVLMISYPLYSGIFYSKDSNTTLVNDSNKQTVNFDVSGMTCSSCEQHITSAVNKLVGVMKSNAEYESGKVIVEYDNSKTKVSEITNAINSTGYKVTNTKN